MRPLLRTIKSICPEPSSALKAMLESIKTAPTWSNFQPDYKKIAEYDTVYKKVFGGLDIMTVYQITGKSPEPFTSPQHLAYSLDLAYEDMLKFMAAIDMFRRGVFTPLLSYYEFDEHKVFYLRPEYLKVHPKEGIRMYANWGDFIFFTGCEDNGAKNRTKKCIESLRKAGL